jgi:hypothetical protein
VNLLGRSPDDPFDLRIGEQRSNRSTAHRPAAAACVDSVQVLVPYLSGRYHRGCRRRAPVSALYADAFQQLVQTIDADFQVPTDPPDEAYSTAAAGVTVVLAGGLMGFVQYLQVLDLDDYSDRVITGGVRYVFGR